MSRSEIIAGDRYARLQRTAKGSSLTLIGAALVCFSAALPLPASGQLERWTLERTVTIGDAVDPETGLTRVGRVIVQDDRLLVAQPMENRIRVFSLTGDFLGFIGREGDGPGEFQRVGGMGVHDGRVWVMDQVLQRLQYFDAEGQLISSERIRSHPSLEADRWLSVRGILPDGSRLVNYALVRAAEEGQPTAVFRFGPDGLLRDTAAMIAGRTNRVQVRINGGATFMSLPESYHSLLSVAPNGSGFVVVHRTQATSTDPHAFRVIRFDARADTAWVRDIPYDPIPVPGAWRSRHVEDEVRRLIDNPGLPEGRARAALERAYGTLEFFPPVRSVLVGADGSIWLSLRTGVEPTEWEVLDESGRSLARVEPPGWLAWVDAESLWVVERDELDVQYLVRYVIRRR